MIHVDDVTGDVQNWTDTRELVQAGDIAFFSGTGMASDIVKTVTGSPWSHVGMVAQLWTRILLVEAVWPENVRGIALSQKISQYPGNVVIARLEGIQSEKALSFIVDHLGSPYGFAAHDFCCSVLIANSLRDQGQTVPSTGPFGITSPDDLWCLPGLTVLARVK